MRVLRSVAVLAVTSGLVLLPATAGWGQQGSGLGSMQTGGIDGSQQTGSQGTGQGSRSGSGTGTGGTGTSSRPMTTNSPSSVMVPMTTDVSPNPQMEQEQAKLRNQDRQKKLVADTERLVALANELKSQVDKSNKDTLSLDVVRKADEIEKLARSVKEKMKGS